MTLDLRQAVRDIQAVHRSLPEVRSAPDMYPSSLASARLPLVAVLPGAGEVSTYVGGAVREERAFVIDVYAAPLGGGELGPSVDEALDVLAAVRNAWAQRLMSEDTGITGVEQIREPITDTGLAPMEFGNKAYLGSRITLRVIIK